MTTYACNHTIRFVTTARIWIYLNRALAWALVVSPLMQIALNMRLAACLRFDLGLLLAHGALSLVLFGLPRIKGRGFVFSMHVLGIRPADLSPRNRFLLSGYRIVLGMTPFLPMLPGIPWFAPLLCIYPILRLPVSVVLHMLDGIKYALQRLRFSAVPAGAIVFLYFVFAIINFFRALFGGWQ
jgi:hypothetical protein